MGEVEEGGGQGTSCETQPVFSSRVGRGGTRGKEGRRGRRESREPGEEEWVPWPVVGEEEAGTCQG